MLRETQVLLAANGNVALAAEVLKIEPAMLLATIAADDDGLNNAMKVAIAVNTIDAMTQVKEALLSRLDELSPSTLAKVFLELVSKGQAIQTGQLQPNLTTNNFSWMREGDQNLNIGDLGDDARNAIEGRIAQLIASGQA